MRIVDLTNQRFGKLLVIRRGETYVSPSGSKSGKWLCLCDCGKECLVGTSKLKTGHTKSCGCLAREKFKNMIHKHGDRKTRLYYIWCSMKQRCHNKMHRVYKLYGGRGITMCKEWNDYCVFKEWAVSNGYSDKLTIDRIDVNGNYEPLNCRWVSQKEQCRNKRDNVFITSNGETHCLSEWEEIKGLPQGTLTQRIKTYGYSEEEALNIPLGVWRGKYANLPTLREDII